MKILRSEALGMQDPISQISSSRVLSYFSRSTRHDEEIVLEEYVDEE